MDKVRFETSDSLEILTLRNPPLNLINGELIADLCATVTEIKQARLRALLVRAEGKIFCGGADVSAFKDRTASEASERFTRHLRLIADLEELPFPTLAAVQGLCIAAGLELALACESDMRSSLGSLLSGRSIDWNYDAAGRRSTSGRARRAEPCPRNHLHRRSVRRRNPRALEHREQGRSG